MVKSGQVSIKAILIGAKELKESLKRLREQISKLDTSFKNIHNLKSLLEDYNNLRDQLLGTLKEPNLYNLLPHISLDFLYIKSIFSSEPPSLKSYLSLSDIDVALSMVERAERGCSIIISICESLLKSKTPQEFLDKLNQLRDEIEKMEKELLEEEEFLIKNIHKALEEYEQGHFLASALIASRVIMYVFEQIPTPEEGREAQKSLDLARLKVEALIEKGVVDKDRKDEQESFMRASKQARNILSHRAYIFPEIEETLMLIASAITFCKYLIRLTK